METPPEIVVELRSNHDEIRDIERKVGDDHAAGMAVVWLIAPATFSVAVRRQGEPAVVLLASATLTAEGVIPGFLLLVGELFRDERPA